jgi:hypothetical protein
MKDTAKPQEDNGMDYYIPQEAIDEYRTWSIEQRLKWLYMGNLLRMDYDRNTIEVQDRFRDGKI